MRLRGETSRETSTTHAAGSPVLPPSFTIHRRPLSVTLSLTPAERAVRSRETEMASIYPLSKNQEPPLSLSLSLRIDSLRTRRRGWCHGSGAGPPVISRLIISLSGVVRSGSEGGAVLHHLRATPRPGGWRAATQPDLGWPHATPWPPMPAE
jgi:hypothetical protein